MNNIYCIWWLSQEAYRQIIPVLDTLELPGYIRKQFRSRVGRPGRGRLWVPEDIPIEEIPWADDAPMGKAADDCGGIVLHERDASKLSFLPGFVTDLKLNLLGTGGQTK